MEGVTGSIPVPPTIRAVLFHHADMSERNDASPDRTPSGQRAASGRIARRFRGRWRQGYVRGKLRHDPSFDAIAVALLDGSRTRPLLDLGCGMGLLGHWLRVRGWTGTYIGIDHDVRKLRAGRAAARGLTPALTLRTGSLLALPPALGSFRGDVVLLDVLHYLTRDAQSALLRRCALCLEDGDVLLLRGVLRDGSWRYGVTRAEEWLLASTGWMRSGPRHVPSAAELRGWLEELDLQVALRPLWGHTPFNSWLTVARRGIR